MGCLVLAHEEEGFFRIAIVEPLDGLVGGDVGAVAGELLFAAVHLKEDGIVVAALSGENFPVVEPYRIRNEMPFSKHRGVVACSLQCFGDRPLGLVETLA